MDNIYEHKISRHQKAILYFNSLLLDLKLQEMGEEFEPITMERLEEGSKHILDIQQCRLPIKYVVA